MEEGLLVQLELLLRPGGVRGGGEVVRPEVGGGRAGRAVKESRVQRFWKRDKNRVVHIRRAKANLSKIQDKHPCMH